MCGILGAFSANQPLSSPAFPAKSLAVMKHRGPDAQGWYVDDHAVLGFRRLAILDLAGGGQPLYSEDEQIAVVVNGEISFVNSRECSRLPCTIAPNVA